MIELKSFLEKLNIDQKKDIRDIMAFLIDNEWFNSVPAKIDDEFLNLFIPFTNRKKNLS